MAAQGEVTLSVDGPAIHRQRAMLEAMYANMMPDDSVEANNLRDTIRLLADIERKLETQGVATH